MKDKANAYFESAFGNLKNANSELLRPEEDVVSFSVCKNAQFAIDHYLRGYLFTNSIDASRFETIQELYDQCKKINKEFEKITFSGFNCISSKINSNYCNEVSKVSHCYTTADELDTFLRKEKIIE